MCKEPEMDNVFGGEIKDRSVKWDVNESLLQSYRNVFIASQSLFVGAVGIMRDEFPLNFIIVLVAVFQLIVGCLVIDARAKIVDFYKFNLNHAPYFKGGDERKNEEKYVKCKSTREKVHCELKSKGTTLETWRDTRKRLDVWIPITFLFIWASFLLKFIWDFSLNNCSPLYFLVLIVSLLLFSFFINFLCFTIFWIYSRKYL